MASRLTIIHTDILSQLQLLKNGASVVFKNINVWDDQIDNMISGDNYSFATPSAFLEVQLGEQKQLGAGITSYPNCEIRIHLVDMLLDAGGGLGDMEQNLRVFGLRDLVKAMGLKATFCSSFQVSREYMDYKHRNIYKYVLCFSTNFLDNKGSSTENGLYIIPNPTFNLNIFQIWVSGVSYFQNSSVVIYNNTIYLCSADNSDITFTPSNWIVVASWTLQKWNIGDYAAFGSRVYQCITANSDTSFTQSNWNLIA
mgnify:CR=1 FL=1